MPDFDVCIIGSGHNALITAAYLAQAGQKVAVFERRDIAGGAVSTKEIVPGYQFDLGGSAHILIRLTPIVEELGLEKFGLEYIDIDPLFYSPFEDGSSVFIYRDATRTAHHLESLFPGEGEAYIRFLEDWQPFARVVKDLFLSVPSPLNLGQKMVFGKAIKGDWKKALPMILKPYGELLDNYFKEEKIKAPLVWMAAQSGPPPSESLTAPFLLWHPLYHEGGMARPRGGSGMLTQALQKHIEAHGGKVYLNAAVSEILVQDKKATGVKLASGDLFTAKRVVAGCHAHTTFQQLLPEQHRPYNSSKMRIGNGFGAIVRLALSEPIRYKAFPGDDARRALQLICRDRQHINNAYADYLRGEPTKDPPIVAMSFSAVDNTLAPPGGEVLWLWAQYYPYELSQGKHWDEIEEEVAESIIDAFEVYAPGTKDKIVGKLFQHPLWLERELGLYRGNVMHLEMTLDQMFALRPFLGMAEYKTHLKGLYLTGASTHPGGGIMGASGRNAARVILQDSERKRLWSLGRSS
ncbi:MAG: NAD(P)/FAD-dependent oxidoreductase [Trueperaceae bacterium]|nr:NAD(P)/FAD-dependent oxidoreductase [Trueperaceae bacterium]